MHEVGVYLPHYEAIKARRLTYQTPVNAFYGQLIDLFLMYEELPIKRRQELLRQVAEEAEFGW